MLEINDEPYFNYLDLTTSCTSFESTLLATKESLGFFTDIPDSAWKRHKERFQLTQPNHIERREGKQDYAAYSNYFWSMNYEPEFTCPHEFRLGKLADGGKWVCDPHRIVSGVTASCLVYSIGSNGNFDFEVNVLNHVSPSCEVHTFDIKDYSRGKNFTEEAVKIGTNFHHWGLGQSKRKGSNMKRFKNIMTELNHQKKTVDLMKIDCERCEYEQYKDWLQDWNDMGVLVRQVMLEVHNSDMPGVDNLFKAFQEAGYVIFHKEANYMNEGKSVEVAFLLLSKDFQVNNEISTVLASK